MIRLKRLKVNRFRNVKPGTELRFDDRRNIVLGRNGTGKTTLLQLISMALRSDFSEVKSEDCDVEFDLVFDEGITRTHFRIEAATPLELRPGDAGPRVELVEPNTTIETRFERFDSPQPHIFVGDGSDWTWDRGDGTVVKPWIRLAPLQRNLVHLLVGAVLGNLPRGDWRSHVPVRFDEALGVFASMTAGEQEFYEAPDEPGHFFSWYAVLPVPMMELVQNRIGGQTGDGVLVYATDLPFLADSLREFGFVEAEFRAELIERTPQQGGGETLRYGRFNYRFRPDERTLFLQDKLSYGEKRLLSFLYYLAMNDHAVVADELVNGLHHEWIDLCVARIGDRQAFLTSQNPLLFDTLEFDSVEAVRSQFVICAKPSPPANSEMVWEQMSAPQAEKFFAAYQVGAQYVSEILLSEKLW